MGYHVGFYVSAGVLTECGFISKSAGDGVSGIKYNNYSDAIQKYWLPWSIFLGVPYDLFWKLNPKKIMPFELAYEQRLKREDEAAYRLGQYFLAAISSGNAGKNLYPKKPLLQDFELYPSGHENHDYAADAERFREYARAYNKQRAERAS